MKISRPPENPDTHNIKQIRKAIDDWMVQTMSEGGLIPTPVYDAIHIIDAALVEPSEPVADLDPDDFPVCGALFTHPAKPEPSEAVAWQLGHRFYTSLKDAEYAWRNDCAFLGTSYVPEPLFTHPAPSKPEPDKDLIQALTERDEYHDMADKLAEGIALHFDGDIGEHSSSNSPWDRALDLLDSAACAETMRLTRPASKQPEPLEVLIDEYRATAEEILLAISPFYKDTLTRRAAIIEQAVISRMKP